MSTKRARAAKPLSERAEFWAEVQAEILTYPQTREWWGVCYAMSVTYRRIPNEAELQRGKTALDALPYPPGVSAYKWPLTPAGDRQRLAFCRRMARPDPRPKGGV